MARCSDDERGGDGLTLQESSPMHLEFRESQTDEQRSRIGAGGCL